MAENGWNEAAVRAHLDAVAASPGFVHGERLTRFLRFTVEAKLRGEESQIKEFILGREVFDRGGDYDPRLDPIVRVEARRLRQRLDEYYAGPGRAEALRIEFPKGSYAPVIRHAALSPTVLPPRRRLWAAAALAGLAALGIAASLYYFRHPAPMIAVIPARWVWSGSEALDPADENLAELITAEIANAGRLGVAGWPLVVRYRGTGRNDAREIGKGLGVERVLVVAVREEQGSPRATVYLLDAATGRKNWVKGWHVPDLEARRRAAAGIAAALPTDSAAAR